MSTDLCERPPTTSRWAVVADVPPPERHSDRVVAALLRELVAEQAKVIDAINAVVAVSRDGNPVAQQRMAERIAKAGAAHVSLTPGKRGRYQMYVHQLVGWDPRQNRPILSGDEIPAKPWLACALTRIDGRRREVDTVPLVFISHHGLSRAAQRCGVRSKDDILAVVFGIWTAVMQATEAMSVDEFVNPPPAGRRLAIEDTNIVFVLKRHCGSVVVTTIFEVDEQNQRGTENGEPAAEDGQVLTS